MPQVPLKFDQISDTEESPSDFCHQAFTCKNHSFGKNFLKLETHHPRSSEIGNTSPSNFRNTSPSNFRNWKHITLEFQTHFQHKGFSLITCTAAILGDLRDLRVIRLISLYGLFHRGLDRCKNGTPEIDEHTNNRFYIISEINYIILIPC